MCLLLLAVVSSGINNPPYILYPKSFEKQWVFPWPIETYKSEGKQEIIDGQQRLTTLMLLLRAFYTRFLNMMDKNSISIRNSIAKCIWKSDEFDNLIEDQLKIDSQVSTNEDKGEFMAILHTGIVQKEYHSRYAKVFSFFQDNIPSIKLITVSLCIRQCPDRFTTIHSSCVAPSFVCGNPCCLVPL